METETDFDIEKAIAGWRQSLSAEAGNASEGENFLRAKLTECLSKGLSAPEAFAVALRRTQPPGASCAESDNCNRSVLWTGRLFWMAIGLLLTHLAFQAGSWIMPSLPGRDVLVISSHLIYAVYLFLTTLAVGTLLWMLAKGRLHTPAEKLKSYYRDRATLAVHVFSAVVVVELITAMFRGYLSTPFTGPDIYSANWRAIFSTAIWPITASLLVVWSARVSQQERDVLVDSYGLDDHQDRPLEQRLDQWRESLLATAAFPPDTLRELESHLREAIDQWRAKGFSEHEAFWVASRRLGTTEKLAPEFAKGQPEIVWRNRVFWMASAVFLEYFWRNTAFLLVWLPERFLQQAGASSPATFLAIADILIAAGFGVLLWMLAQGRFQGTIQPLASWCNKRAHLGFWLFALMAAQYGIGHGLIVLVDLVKGAASHGNGLPSYVNWMWQIMNWIYPIMIGAILIALAPIRNRQQTTSS